MYIITITIGLKIFFITVKIHVLTSFVVDNNDIKTTPVWRVISSIDFNVGPRASVQCASPFFINKALTFNRKR